MTIHLITIGQEILSGNILNTNSEFLAKELAKEGYEVTKMITIPDDLAEMNSTFLQSLSQADLVITTGGLGPTLDDETKKALCHAFGDQMALFPEALRDLEKRFGKEMPGLEDQASAPSKATLLLNPFGTAPGIYIDDAKGRVIALPGVPSQMKAIFQESVLSLIHQFMKNNPVVEKELHFALLPETAFDPLLREWKKKSSLEIGIYPHYGFVTIRVKSKKGNIEEVNLFESDLKKHFRSKLYSEKDPRLELAFHEKMISLHKTFALAESCTGGHFASRLTALSGSSKYFLGGIVTYSDQMKVDFLGVNREILRKEGAVSAECVQEMAEGLLKKVPADLVVAISGIAGPEGGSVDKPVGTVWICYGTKNNLHVDLLPLKQNLPRLVLIDYAINWVLGKLLTGDLL